VRVFSLKLPPEMYEKLRYYSLITGKSRGELIREALVEYFDKLEKRYGAPYQSPKSRWKISTLRLPD